MLLRDYHIAPTTQYHNHDCHQLLMHRNQQIHLAAAAASSPLDGQDDETKTPQLVKAAQKEHLENDEAAIERYNAALILLQNDTLRDRVDPLNDNSNNEAATTTNATRTRVPFRPKVKYLGVLVDAGRSYLPIPWLKRLIVYLHRLRYNMIHFRLSDDQAFNLQLRSYPKLAFASPTRTDNRTYTPQELRDLVAFAKQYDIAMMPEINVPGHAGSWAGLPNITIQCPNFICAKGYGIPLNIEHPDIRKILKGVLAEVIDIFDNPPMLHLGGDEVSMAAGCFKEAGIGMFDYTEFEQMLKQILQELDYPEDQVLRWEETPQLSGETYDPRKPRPSFRAGSIEHYWHDIPGTRTNNKGEVVEDVPPSNPFFVSRKLYMDTNHDTGSPDLFQSTLNNLQLEKGSAYFPTGVIVGAFELDAPLWMQRNLVGRLLVVAMGAAQLNLTNTTQILKTYDKICRDTLGLDPLVCDLQGFTAVPLINYNTNWRLNWHHWKHGICNRLTERTDKLLMTDLPKHREHALQKGNKYMWQTMNKPLRVLANSNDGETPKDISKSASGTQTGVLLDLVNSLQPVNRTSQIMQQYLAPLGISLLQLRLVDNNAFAIDLEKQPLLAFSPQETISNLLPNSSDIASLVQQATKFGIRAFPEISISTDAGGWGGAGFLLKCPETYCNGGDARNGVMANDIANTDFLPVVYSVLRELLDIFSGGTSSSSSSARPYLLHLGSDERVSNQRCFEEAGQLGTLSYSDFERNLTMIVEDMIGLSSDNIIRWENREKERYPDRAGEITHYRSTVPFQIPAIRRKNEPFFLTIDILAPATFFDIYKNTRELMTLQPQAIFAELRMLDDETWTSYKVGLRLTAFHI